MNKYHFSVFEQQRIMNGECSPEDIIAEQKEEERHCRED